MSVMISQLTVISTLILSLDICLGFCPEKLVSIKCLKDRAQTYVNFGLLPVTGPWEEFAGINVLHLSTESSNTDDLVPVQLDLPASQLMYSVDYDQFRLQRKDGVISSTHDFLLEIVWPVNESGDPYMWTVNTQCHFRNELTIKTTPLTFDSDSQANPAQEIVFQAGRPSLMNNNMIAEYNVGEQLQLTFRVPNGTYAVLEDCAFAAASDSRDDFLAAWSESACHLIRARKPANDQTCIFGGNIIDVRNRTSTLMTNTEEAGSAVSTIRWTAFKLDQRESSVICRMRVCQRPENPICLTPSTVKDAAAARSAEYVEDDADSTSFVIFTHRFFVTDATTASPTEATTSISFTGESPLSTRFTYPNMICLKSEYMWTIFGLLLSGIILATGLLIYLQEQRTWLVFTKFLAVIPHVAVTTERPLAIRRPHLRQLASNSELRVMPTSTHL